MLADNVLVRDAISSFAGEIFRSMPRVDQRRWAEVYLKGLLLVQGKKTVRKISDDVLSIPAHQSLQQFINQSPWSWEPVRAHIVEYTEKAEPPRAWVLDRVAIPKRGERSVGVGRHYLPEAGRVVNSQIGLTTVLATDRGGIPVNWRLLMPEKWTSDRELREAAYVPEEVQPNPEWAEYLDMVDELDMSWDSARAPVVADLRQVQDSGKLVAGLAERGLEFVTEIDGSLEMCTGAHARENVKTHGRKGALGRAMTALDFSFLSTRRRRVPQDASGHLKVVSHAVSVPVGDEGGFREARLLSEVARNGMPKRFWVTSLTGESVGDVLDLARLAKRTREELPTLDAFGLRDFEGRSFRGWHHHATMVSAAYALDRLGWQPEGDADTDH